MKRMLQLVLVILALLGLTGCVESIDAGEPTATYYCDVKVLSLRNSEIVIHQDSKAGEELYKIEGNIVRLVTDPINMYKFEDGVLNKDKIIGNATDTYHLFTQDDHSVYLSGDFVFTMKGKYDAITNKYDIVNYEGNNIGFAKFDYLNLNGNLYDANNNLVATYVSAWVEDFSFLKDYDYIVKIYDDSFAPKEAILLLFAAFNSDKVADNSSSNSNN